MEIKKYNEYILESINDCKYCHGAKTILCHKCDGNETIKCVACKGKGKINGEECQECFGNCEDICDVCNGDGVVICPNCCDVEEVVDEKISSVPYGCQTWVPNTCTRCGGSLKIDCDECYNNTNSDLLDIKCGKCLGSGLISCPDCCSVM